MTLLHSAEREPTDVPASVAFHRGADAVLRVAGEFDGLRDRLGQGGDVLTSLSWFLDHSARSNWTPLLALVRCGGRLRGAVLLHGRRARGGLGTGVFRAGELCGRGAVVGAPSEQAWLAEAAAYALVQRGATHTVLVRLLHPGVDQVGGAPARGSARSWRMRQSRTRLPLHGGIDGVLPRFSYKTRRNYRYYRKRAEEGLGARFLPRLSPEEAQAAVEALCARGPWPSPREYALARERALRAVPGHLAMGLRDSSGNWLSFLAGWRQGGRTLVEWQLNETEAEGMSFSTAMRSYLVEHEAGLGAGELVFVGETTGSWERACLPDTCGDLLVSRTGLLGQVTRALGRRLRPGGQVERLRQRAGSAFHVVGSGDADTKTEPAP